MIDEEYIKKTNTQEQRYTFKEGLQAYLGNIPLSYNPYKPGTISYISWESGWFKGNYDEREYFQK